jgi:PAS domain S-box-containing protein
LGTRQAQTLLDQLAELVGPDLSIGLAEADGKYLVGTSKWKERQIRLALQSFSAERAADTPTQTLFPLHVLGELVGALVVSGDITPEARQGLETSQYLMELILAQAVEKRAVADETLDRYREINLLYNIGETIGSCLDPDEIPQLVLAETRRVIDADMGMVLLPSDKAGASLDSKAVYGKREHHNAMRDESELVINQVLETGHPTIVNDLPQDSQSISAVLCAPLKTQERVLGVIILGQKDPGSMFTAGDEKLLTALAGQAAIAVENAHLFADVTLQRDEIAEIKSYMDNIFASIASGVITTDNSDSITTINKPAEQILAVTADESIGRSYLEVLPGLAKGLSPFVDRVRQQDEQVTGYEMELELSRRGPAVVRLHVSPLKDNSGNTTGIAIVIDDLTEQRQLEKRVQHVRTTFERYVAPQVVDQLLSDPDRVRLGGVRQEVTTLFADIRGFTAFSGRVQPDMQIEVLNRHLTLAVEAVLAQEGTLDKFAGDSVMALFNAPLSQPDHVLRSVRAALAMQRAIAEMHTDLPPEERLSFGVGITTGQAVVGNIGSAQIHNYTAIGQSVNLAHRLQAHAQPGQILVSQTAYEMVAEHVVGQEVGLVEVKGHNEPIMVYEVLALQES